jgi:cytidine deaminase
MYDIDHLCNLAIDVMKRAYVPYSKYPVGAALLTKSGTIYVGVNVENASYGITNCAERSAIFTAVSHGEQDFVAIAVATEDDKPGSPCGSCRQVMWEFGDFDVILTNTEGKRKQFTVSQLLPEGFLLDRSQRAKRKEDVD